MATARAQVPGVGCPHSGDLWCRVLAGLTAFTALHIHPKHRRGARGPRAGIPTQDCRAPKFSVLYSSQPEPSYPKCPFRSHPRAVSVAEGDQAPRLMDEEMEAMRWGVTGPGPPASGPTLCPPHPQGGRTGEAPTEPATSSPRPIHLPSWNLYLRTPRNQERRN